MIRIADIRANLKCQSLIAGVDQVPKGHARVETTFKYPDGGAIEVFVVDDKSAPLLPPTVLSDMGQTTGWLLNMQIKPWLSKRRQSFVDDVLEVYGVRQNGGSLELNFSGLEDLEPKIVTLAQACLRISDLAFTRRISLQTTFGDELEELLVDDDLAYESNVDLLGKYAPVRVDFLVHAPGRDSALIGLSSGNSGQAHIAATEIFKKWYDLTLPCSRIERVTVFDDRYDVYRDEDMARLREVSDVIALSDRQGVIDCLRVAA